MTEPANGSTPWHQTSWTTINEAAAFLSIPTDTLRPILRNNGIDAGPEDRWPLEVIIAAVDAASYRPKRLHPVGPRSRTSRLGG